MRESEPGSVCLKMLKKSSAWDRCSLEDEEDMRWEIRVFKYEKEMRWETRIWKVEAGSGPRIAASC